MRYAIIVAGGVGSRSGDSLPKQFHVLLGLPLLRWTIDAFHRENPNTRIIVVMHPDFIGHWEKIKGTDCPAHLVVAGGASRTASVAEGLAVIPANATGLVAIHDAARPLADSRLISDGWRYAELYGAALPGLPVSDSLREGTADESHSVDRSRFFTVQTPQVFDLRLLKDAYAKASDSEGIVFTDDASVAEWAGHRVYIYPGSPLNIKVTYPSDFRIAELLLSSKPEP